MPTPTYTALANLTLSATDSDVTFSNIPNTYRDLVLVTTLRNSAYGTPFSQMRLRINGDTGASYADVLMSGDGSGSGGGGGAVGGGATEITVYFTEPNTSSHFSTAVIQLIDYSVTNKHKNMLIRTNAPSTNVGAYGARWASNTAVSSISVFPPPGYGSWVIGSTFALYGIVA